MESSSFQKNVVAVVVFLSLTAKRLEMAAP
jgi:hypothetical protein